MLYREVIDICCYNHIKHIITLCRQNYGFPSVTAGSTCLLQFWYNYNYSKLQVSKFKPTVLLIEQLVMMSVVLSA